MLFRSEERIRYAKSTGQTHLHVIVGKGNHSAAHLQKIKPRVEQICQQEGLQYHTEPNEGRIYINLTGGPATDVPPIGQGYPPQQAQYGGGQQQQQYGGQQEYHGGQQQYQGQDQGQGQGQDDEVEKLVMKFLPRIMRKLEQNCCVIM